MTKRLIILLMGVFVIFHSIAQPLLRITGTIRDSIGTPLTQATIRIWNDRDTVFVLSGNHGQFTVSLPMSPNEFNIRVTMKEFLPYRSHFAVPSGSALFTVPKIILVPAIQELETVIVRREQPLKIRRDTLEFSAAAYSMREGALLNDLMKKLPGVELDPDSGLIVMGAKVQKLLIDGRAFYGGDIQVALKNLPYDIIDKVEIIDDFGDRARLTGVRIGQPVKVLNIVLRKDKSRSLVGNVEAGGGDKGQYISNIMANLFDGPQKLSLMAAASNNSGYGPDYVKWLGGSYANSWGPLRSVTGNSSLATEDHSFSSALTENSFYPADQLASQQNTFSLITSTRPHADAEFIDDRGANRQLRVNDGLDINHSIETDQIGLSSTETDSGLTKLTQSNSLNQLSTEKFKNGTELDYQQALSPSGHRFSVNARAEYELDQQTGTYSTQSRVISGGTAVDTQQVYRMTNESRALDFNATVHYFFPLHLGGFLETAYGLHWTGTQSDKSWLTPGGAGKSWVTVDSLSNDYNFRTTVHDLHVGYSRHSDRLDLNLGVSASPGTLLNYHYFNILPGGSVTYNPSASRRLILAYSSTVMPPVLQQVQPVTDLSNPQYPVTGNPDLRPTLEQSVGLNYEFNSLQQTRYHGFGVGIKYTTWSNQVISDVVLPQDTSTVIQHTYFVNANGVNNLSANWRLDLPPLFNNRLKIEARGNAGRSRSVSMADAATFLTQTWSYGQYLTLHYTIPDHFELKCSGGYQYNYTQYIEGVGTPYRNTIVNLRIDNTIYFLREWKLVSILLQAYNSPTGGRLQSQPVYLYSTLERSFMKKRQLTCGLVGSNLFNAASGLWQSQTPNTISQRKDGLLGRTVLFSAKWMFEKMRNTRNYTTKIPYSDRK